MEVWWLIFGIADPKVHVDEEHVTKLATGNLFSCHACGWCEAVIEVDSEAETASFCFGYHGFGVGQVIADRFFNKNMCPGGERLHRGGIVIGAILDAGSCDGNHMDIFFAEERFDVVVGLDTKFTCGGIGALVDDVADGDKLGEWVGFIDASVCSPNISHADDGCTYCHAFPLPVRSMIGTLVCR